MLEKHLDKEDINALKHNAMLPRSQQKKRIRMADEEMANSMQHDFEKIQKL